MPLTHQQAAHVFREALQRMERTCPISKIFKTPDEAKSAWIEASGDDATIVELLKAGEFDKDFAGLFGHY